MGKGMLEKTWWSVVLRGIAAIAIGVICLSWTQPTEKALVILFGIFFIVYGIASLFEAQRAKARQEKYTVELVIGIVAVAAGILTLAWPSITARALLYLIAIWAIVTGGIELAPAFMKELPSPARWVFGMTGLVSIIFGILLISFPKGGATAIVWLIGLYALLLGVLLVVIGVGLRTWGIDVSREEDVNP